jgi:hypothetical protein
VMTSGKFPFAARSSSSGDARAGEADPWLKDLT